VTLGFVARGEAGPTMVALHGGLLGGRLTFGPVLPAWSRRLRVLVPDRRGYERTPHPASGSIVEQADDLLAFLAAHGPDGRAHVVAASFGGVVALTALQQQPAAFRSLTLLEAPAVTLAEPADPEVAAWRAELTALHHRWTDDDEAVLRRFLARSDPGSLEPLLRLLHAGDPGLTVQRSELRPWETPLSREGVRGVDVPVLVVSGERSLPMFARIGAHVARLLGAEHLVVPGAGHAVHLAGRRLLDPLRRFVADAEAHTAHLVPLQIAEHDRSWPGAFAAECGVLARALGACAAAIEHVGSTAVPGLAAKPVIDLLVGAAGDLDACVEPIQAQGYASWADEGSADRRFLLRCADGVRTHHVSVVAHAGGRWQATVAFRDALRADPALRDAYAALKRELAFRHRHEREAYTEAKSAFIAAAVG
jgi:GrpB-like predicted nucleotidyltransferase (UPF0157 family)/pimeloyl-ACP methyl ester carboxylesterase